MLSQVVPCGQGLAWPLIGGSARLPQSCLLPLSQSPAASWLPQAQLTGCARPPGLQSTDASTWSWFKPQKVTSSLCGPKRGRSQGIPLPHTMLLSASHDHAQGGSAQLTGGVGATATPSSLPGAALSAENIVCGGWWSPAYLGQLQSAQGRPSSTKAEDHGVPRPESTVVIAMHSACTCTGTAQGGKKGPPVGGNPFMAEPHGPSLEGKPRAAGFCWTGSFIHNLRSSTSWR